MTGNPPGNASRKAVMLAAADLIERPGHYDFFMIYLPRSCNDAGCVLGWIGFCAEVSSPGLGDAGLLNAAQYLGYADDDDFYDAMDEVCEEMTQPVGNEVAWHNSASVAADCLRKLAETVT